MDAWLSRLKGGACLDEDEVRTLCTMVRCLVLFTCLVRRHRPRARLTTQRQSNPAAPRARQVKDILLEESNIPTVRSPVTVRGQGVAKPGLRRLFEC